MNQENQRITQSQQIKPQNHQQIFPLNPIYILPKSATPLNTPISTNSERQKQIYILNKSSRKGSQISNIQLHKLQQQLNHYKRIAGQMQNGRDWRQANKKDQYIVKNQESDIMKSIKTINEGYKAELKSAEAKKAKNEFQKLLFKKQLDNIQKQKQQLLKTILNEQYKSTTLSQQLSQLSRKYHQLKSSKDIQISTLKIQLQKSKSKQHQLQSLIRQLKYQTSQIPAYKQKIQNNSIIINKFSLQLKQKQYDLKLAKQKLIKLQQNKNKTNQQLCKEIKMNKIKIQEQNKQKIQIIKSLQNKLNNKNNQFQILKKQFFNLYNNYNIQIQLKNKDIFYLNQEIKHQKHAFIQNNQTNQHLKSKIQLFTANQTKMHEHCIFLANQNQNYKKIITKLQQMMTAQRQTSIMLKNNIQELQVQMANSRQLIGLYQEQMKKRQLKNTQLNLNLQAKEEQVKKNMINIQDLNQQIRQLTIQKDSYKIQLQAKTKQLAYSLEQYAQSITQQQARNIFIQRQSVKTKQELEMILKIRIEEIQKFTLLLNEKQAQNDCKISQIAALKRQLHDKNLQIDNNNVTISKLIQENKKQKTSNILTLQQNQQQMAALNKQMQLQISKWKESQLQLIAQKLYLQASIEQLNAKMKERISQNEQLRDYIERLTQQRQQLARVMEMKTKQIMQLKQGLIILQNELTQKYTEQIDRTQQIHRVQIEKAKTQKQNLNNTVGLTKHQFNTLSFDHQALKLLHNNSISQLTLKLQQKATRNAQLLKMIQSLQEQRQAMSKVMQSKSKQIIQLKRNLINTEMQLTNHYSQQILRIRQQHKEQMKKMQIILQQYSKESLQVKEKAKNTQIALQQQIMRISSLKTFEQAKNQQLSTELTSKINMSKSQRQHFLSQIQKLKEQRLQMAKVIENQSINLALVKQKNIQAQNNIRISHEKEINQVKAKLWQQIHKLQAILNEQKSRAQLNQRMLASENAKMKNQLQQAVYKYQNALFEREQLITQQAKDIDKLKVSISHNDSTLRNALDSQRKRSQSLDEQNKKKLNQIYYLMRVNNQLGQRIRLLQLQKGSLAEDYNRVIFEFENIKKILMALNKQRQILITYYIQMQNHLEQIKEDPLLKKYLNLFAQSITKITIHHNQIDKSLLNVNERLNHMHSTFVNQNNLFIIDHQAQ